MYNPERITWKTRLGFRIYEREFEFRSDLALGPDALYKLIPPNALLGEPKGVGDIFRLIAEKDSDGRGLYWNDLLLNGIEDHHAEHLEVLDCKIQYALALALIPDWLFLHSGAVSIRGMGVMIPGRSFSGKTSLTLEFLRAGAEYLTDDCTVIDKSGRIHPYASPLKTRKGPGDEQRILSTPEALGAKTANDPVPVCCIVFSEYMEDARWLPDKIGAGKAAWKLLSELFYAPALREEPANAFSILEKITRDSLILQGVRGEASEVVSDVLERLEGSG